MKIDTLKLTYVGMIGAILTIIGDFLLLGVDSNASGGGLFDKYLDIASKISYTRIGLAGFFGYLGIPLTAIGFLALHQMIKDKESHLAKVYKWSMLICFAALGGGVHIICCYLVAGMKMNIDSGTADVVSAVIHQQAGFLVPSFIVFFAVYLVACISMAVLIAKGKTILPKWMWILNPLIMKLMINALGKLGTSAFFNGLACSNMSLGALVILLTWMIAIKRIGDRKEQ
jgi:magnesium-transporting ATPase (P-type)